MFEIRTDAYGRRCYADVRRAAPRAEGFVAAAAGLKRLPQEVKPLFHPFRFYVLQQLLQPVIDGPRPNITPMSTSTTSGMESYLRLVEKVLEEYNDYTSGESFLSWTLRRITTFDDNCESTYLASSSPRSPIQS